MEESDERAARGFKVEDRRRFSAEGELKPEHRTPETRAEDSATKGPTGGEKAAAADEAQAKAYASAKAGGSAALPEITFGTFLVSLSTQALVHLGEIPDPLTGAVARNLAAAQQLIDILGILGEKTRGNLSHDETELLDAILFDLRMKYVEFAHHPS